MFEISTEASFSAAHRLINYDGPCENTHGHNWLVRVSVRCEKLNDIGIGIDFKILRGMLRDVLAAYDHTDLNLIFDKRGLNPSSENTALCIYADMAAKLTGYGCTMHRVDVYETPGNCASYFEHA
jgi:6-pyruvoyltetrahydropterin/6-carboxytetrahydropterin synthase